MKLISLYFAGSLLLFSFFFSSCEALEEGICDGKGTLRVENTSLHTVQKIIIDGKNYGTLDPGDFQEIPLNEGKYLVEIIGISGGGGCLAHYVTISECDTQISGCSG